ncbi:MAG: uroporphyrinogen-III C-methyltransferase [Gammaproteobacteria bacterium]|nr:uroporphyrinogen-III C-methyltransferase [Gammaproteobacteria bacterium]
MKKGFVSLVGAGPGDPDLLTIKALRYLKEAEVVVYDRLVSKEILRLVPHGISRISVGKSAGKHCVPQDQINQVLVNLALSGRRVIRLKGGDPYLFGRGGEEALVLKQHNIRFDVVPGITAASACSTYSGIPLTQRGMNHGVRFITGHLHNDDDMQIDWDKIADPECTLAIYMGLSNLPTITQKLINSGLAETTPAAAIHGGSTHDQVKIISTLAELDNSVKQAKLQSPVMIIVGRVVALSDELDWYQSECKHAEHNVEDEVFDSIRA